MFGAYKKERVESERAVEKTNERLQEQVSDLRSQNAKISTQLEFASKRSARANTLLTPQGLAWATGMTV